MAKQARNQAEFELRLAKAMLQLDKKVQGITKAVDTYVDKQLTGHGGREYTTFNGCEVRSGALPVDVALQAVQYGAIRVALRVLPRMAEAFLKGQVLTFVQKVAAAKAAAAAMKAAGKKIPLVGDLVTVVVGLKGAIDYNAEMRTYIEAVLGCTPTDFDPSPMRYALNVQMAKVKAIGKREPRRVKRVHTRKPDGTDHRIV